MTFPNSFEITGEHMGLIGVGYLAFVFKRTKDNANVLYIGPSLNHKFEVFLELTGIFKSEHVNLNIVQVNRLRKRP